MDLNATRLPYRQTNAFNKIVLDYIDQSNDLKPFFEHPPNIQGIQNAIRARKKFSTNRAALVDVLKQQYTKVEVNEKITKNIKSLVSEDTFTVTTAHQSNIFTGPLYFIYKIAHVIRLAEHLNSLLPGNRFVPLFYMGSEDADLSELNHIYMGSERLEWKTNQQGAVGRMIIDKPFLELIEKLRGQLSVLPFGTELVSMLSETYKEGSTLQDATFRFIHRLFGDFGILVLIPDSPALKKQIAGVIKDDLLNQEPSAIVRETVSELEKTGYKVQANPREINLFYLHDAMRERIVLDNGKYGVLNSTTFFSREEILDELKNHPEHFSPNVILRGIYQSTILPDVAFIGGGGELAYWLEFKSLFAHYKTPFPVLVLRNSFLLLEKKRDEVVKKLGLDPGDLFLHEDELVKLVVSRIAGTELQLNGNFNAAEDLYAEIKLKAAEVDPTLVKHVEALKTKTLLKLRELEKKLVRAEKRKHADKIRQLKQLKMHLFPGNGLQERNDNLLYYYSKWGNEFLTQLLNHSPALEHEFTVLTER